MLQFDSFMFSCVFYVYYLGLAKIGDVQCCSCQGTLYTLSTWATLNHFERLPWAGAHFNIQRAAMINKGLNC